MGVSVGEVSGVELKVEVRSEQTGKDLMMADQVVC